VASAIRRNDVLEYRWLSRDVDPPSADGHQQLGRGYPFIDARIDCAGARPSVRDMHIGSARVSADVLRRSDGRRREPEHKVIELGRVRAEALGYARA
jgi:hypothetical protein